MLRSVPRRIGRFTVLAAALVAAALSGCTSGSGSPSHSSSAAQQPSSSPQSSGTTAAHAAASSSGAPSSSASSTGGEFTINFVGDVHFSGRVSKRLAANPRTVFGVAQPGLAAANLTMVNLETAITDGHGTRQDKAYAFMAPPVALSALRDAGVDVATMANNHGADFGSGGLADTLHAIRRSHFPVIGIGKDEDAAFAPYRTTIAGTKLAIFAADQVDDETTLRLFSAGPHKPGVANAHYARLISDVAAARKAGWTVVVYLHWGIELKTCPTDLQRGLASRLAKAGAAAVVGTHAHVLQGAGWKPDGTYVAYGLSNYLWWESYHNEQDDNGVLTLRFRDGLVVGSRFAPSHLDSTGVPVPATGATKKRIDAEWVRDRACAGGLSADPPK